MIFKKDLINYSYLNPLDWQRWKLSALFVDLSQKISMITWESMIQMSWNVKNVGKRLKFHNYFQFIENFSSFFKYFRSIRSLHFLCTARVLEDFNLVLHDFKVNFEYLFENFHLNMTLKVHIISLFHQKWRQKSWFQS